LCRSGPLTCCKLARVVVDTVVVAAVTVHTSSTLRVFHWFLQTYTLCMLPYCMAVRVCVYSIQGVKVMWCIESS
jgi:hypothetical protein